MTDRFNEGAEACVARPKVSGDEFNDWEDLHRNPMIEGVRSETHGVAVNQALHPSFGDDGEGNFA